MPSTLDLQELRLAQSELSDRAVRDVQRYWGTLDLDRPERARNGLLEFVPAVTAAYGEGSATVAADWYDDMRVGVGARQRFAAAPASAVAVNRVQDSVRYGARHLFTENPGQMLLFLGGAVQGFVQQPGRETIQQNATRDPASHGWRRRASADACAYCAYMAVVLDQPNYERAASKYHDGCRCVPVMVFAGSELPEQPNGDEWRGVFDQARADILREREQLPGWRTMRRGDRSRRYPEYQVTTKNILARARRMQPSLFRDGVRLAA